MRKTNFCIESCLMWEYSGSSNGSGLQLEGRHVLIIGDVILDGYIWGDVNRISPEAPVPVLEIASETTRTGGAANVAQNIVNLGGRVDLIGVVSGMIVTERN